MKNFKKFNKTKYTNRKIFNSNKNIILKNFNRTFQNVYHKDSLI